MRASVDPTSQNFAAHPLAQLAAGFALGILAALYFAVSLSLLLGLTAFTSMLAGGTFLARMRTPISKASGQSRLSVAAMLVTLATFFLGATLATIEKVEVPANQIKSLINAGSIIVGEPVELTGVLERDPEIASDRLYLQLRVRKIRSRAIDQKAVPETGQTESVERETSGVVMLLAVLDNKSTAREFEQLELRYGARIRVMTMLERSDEFRNPGVSSFTEYLDRKGYDASGFVKSPLLIERLDDERVFLPLAWLYQWRRTLQREIDSRFSSETAGVLDAALLGNRYNLSRSTSERFREGGTFHVLVISGLHITFLGGVVFLIARRLTKSRTVQFMLPATVLWAYSLAVGAESSVVRAALMFTLILFGPLVARHASSLNALGAAALALLAWRPADLLDPSFQLTIVSVLAIVLLAWPLLRKMSEIGAWRPTRETPYPPSCAPALRSFAECLFWSEREAKRELERATYNYRLFKTPLAGTLERFHLQRLFRYVFGAIVVSASVQLALLPLLVVYFHRLPLASLLLNIGVSLLMAIVAILAVASLLIAQVNSAIAAPLISAANYLNWLMVHSVDPFAMVGAASIRLPEYAGWAGMIYGLYYLPLTALTVALSRWRPLQLPPKESLGTRRITQLAVMVQLAATALIVFHPFSAGAPDGKLRIDFLDVGQADSTLITFPDKTTLLIDGGGRPGPFQRDRSPRVVNGEDDEHFERESRSIGETVVSEYLWWRGLDHVDYILATHADADHMDGLNDVARNFKVRAALVARTPGQDPEYDRFALTLGNQGIPLRVVGAGDVLRFGQVTASVLWPLPSGNPNAAARNNDSIVLRFQFGERVLLLTGDIEKAGEAGLLRGNDDLRADLVRVAHHGSKTSSIAPFVAATQPRFAVISVGQNSIFGHPNPDVVERWRAAGAEVLTTGNCGTITLTTDGRELRVESYVAERPGR